MADEETVKFRNMLWPTMNAINSPIELYANEYDAPLSLICEENSAYGKLEKTAQMVVNKNVNATAGPASLADPTMEEYTPAPSIPPILIRN